jgi:hypothetical protein
MAAGVMLVVICGLAAWLLFRGADHRRQVLVVTAQVAPGQVLTADDVAVVNVVVGPQVHTVAAGDINAVVGQKAVFGLTPGSLLDPGALTAGPAVDANQVLMGVSLKPGFFPSTVHAGDSVVLLVVPGSSSSANGAVPLGDDTPVEARVVRVRPPSANSGDNTTTVDLAVPRDASQAIAVAASANQVVLAVGR